MSGMEKQLAGFATGNADWQARKEAAAKRKKRPQAAPAEVAEAPAVEPEQGDTEDGIGDLAAQVAAEQVEVVPQPQTSEPGAPAEVPFQVKSPSEQLADKAQVASITQAADTGWMINLGDYATKNDAQAVLQMLRKRMPDVVAGRTAQTVMIEKAGTVTYRARFTGFDEPASASACKALKKQKTPCQPQGPS